eukprot:1891847-Prymnesium_polylepis.1
MLGVALKKLGHVGPVCFWFRKGGATGEIGCGIARDLMFALPAATAPRAQGARCGKSARV